MDNRQPRRVVEIYRSPVKTVKAPVIAQQKISIKTRPVQHEKDGQAPISPSTTAIETKTAEISKRMKEASKFYTDYGDLAEGILEFLSPCSNFNVISAIGPQGSGKSTILSMLAGNNARHMYREYYFRPVSREANELSRHQTIKLEIFVVNHHIFIDCQPSHSFSILETLSRNSRIDNSTGLVDTIKLTALLIFISHTVLVISENIMDLSLLKTIHAAELLRPCLKTFEPKLDVQRKTNLIFVQSKAQSIDFSPMINEERETILKKMFENSRWLHVSNEKNRVLFPLIEFRLTKDQLYENSDIDSQTDEDNSTAEFDEGIHKLREELIKNQSPFTEMIGVMDEKKWLEMTSEALKNETFIHGLRSLSRCEIEK